MQSKILLAILSSSLLSLASGAAIDARAALDIFSPRIISPNTTTTWVVGQVETVTWDPSNAPVNISNRAEVFLDSLATGFPVPILQMAIDFDLRSGSVDVTVPTTVVPGQYRITLFGDSGNRSPVFKIVSA